MYKLISFFDFVSQEYKPKCILRIVDNAFIPFDPANTDYQAYLQWLAEGNEPEPADEGESN